MHISSAVMIVATQLLLLQLFVAFLPFALALMDFSDTISMAIAHSSCHGFAYAS